MNESENKISGSTWIAIIGLIVAIAAFVFGDNLYQQITGHSFFSSSNPTPTPQILTTESVVSTEIIDITSTPRVNELVTVDANVRWVDSGILIQKDDLVKISYVSGLWGPSGSSLHAGWNCDSPYYSAGLMPTAPGSSLIARIENNAPFCVGASPVFTSQYSGNLYFSYNDCESTGCFNDNAGSLDLKVVVRAK
jgi:hypothetical protein